MRTRTIWAVAGIAGLAAAAVAAQAQWARDGWGPGRGGAMGLGRTEGSIEANINEFGGVTVTVSGCGGERDYRVFGTEVEGEDARTRDVAAALNRLLAEARRVCGLEEALTSRVEQGLQPAYVAYLEELAVGNTMGMDMIDTNSPIECPPEDCNAM